MKLFTCGPVNLFPSVERVREKNILYFRSHEYGSFVLEVLQRLSKLLGNSSHLSMFPMSCSGTGAMESSIENCVAKEDKVLVINGGGFGKRWCELLKAHGCTFESVDLVWNEELTESLLAPYSNQGFTMLFVNLDETTSGQLYSADLLHRFCERNRLLGADA